MKNVVEIVVAREFEQLKRTLENLPDTPEFRDDVLAYALNRLPPRYVAQRTGEVVTTLAMDSDQERARISVILMKAIEVVQKIPREER